MCSNGVFGGGYCISHQYLRQDKKPKVRDLDKKPIPKIREKTREKLSRKKTWLKEVHGFLIELWEIRKETDDFGSYVSCFETGERLGEESYKYNSCCYSHYLEKSVYPEFAMEQWNVEIVHPDVHARWEKNKKNCPKMYTKYQKLYEEWIL